MIPVTEDYITMTTLMLLSDDMGRTLRVLVLTGFKVLSQAQQLFGGATEIHEICQIYSSVS